ncbi:MAG: CBS domain-containing protein [Gammaproteobacteria bacterium]|nr:CBS domain-containing protein [Gammaproteobacteria bacterium]
MKQNLVHTLVSDCMNPYLITIGPYASLAEAYEIMIKNQIRRLPVVNKDELIGIITMSDILEAKPSDIKHSLSTDEMNTLLSTIIVELVMTRKPIIIYQTDTLGHASELMLDNKIGGLPVVDANNKLAGLITESDIFRMIVRKWRDDNIIHAHAK